MSGAVFAPPFEDLDPNKDLNGQNALFLGNGHFPSGTSSLWGGFGIHQIEEREHFNRLGGRNFVLTQTPIPEPGSLALLGVGIMGLIFSGRRRRVQGHQKIQFAAGRRYLDGYPRVSFVVPRKR